MAKRPLTPSTKTPWVKAFWWPRFVTLAGWFISLEQRRREEIERSFAEIEGEMIIPGLTGDFKLTARADRIDLLKDGSLRVIDYKTGTLATKKAVTEARALQLRVEAVLAAHGGFQDLNGKHAVSALEYWKVDGRETAPLSLMM